MNLAELANRLRERRDVLVDIRKTVPYGYLKTYRETKRVETLIERVEARLAAQKASERHQNTIRYLGVAKQRWLKGKRFVAIDVERNQGRLSEIGVTIIQGRRIESFDYQIEGLHRDVPFDFGKRLVGRHDLIAKILIEHANAADFYIGHSFRHDLNFLEEAEIAIPRKFYYDTSEYARHFLGKGAKLVELARYFNVGGTHFHCAGNDARYTAEIFLKAVNSV